MDLAHLFEMGSYTAYVWSAYGITAVGLMWIAWSAHRQLKQQKVEARRRRQRADHQ
jgi:heme exporter protein CcmD